jgi:hypothetical protein
MPIPIAFQLALGPTGDEYAESIDMTTVLGMRPLPASERPAGSAENGSPNRSRERKC